jgi:hypothetical protein
MKYLKKYNEELDPKKYKRAGSELYKMGHIDRGINLQTYGHEKANDIFDFWVGDSYAKKFANPIEAYFKYYSIKFTPTKNDNDVLQDDLFFSDYQFNDYNSNKYQMEFWEEIMKELVSKYKMGGIDLYLDFKLDFSISPRQKKQLKDLSDEIFKNNGVSSVSSDVDETYLKDLHLIHALASDNIYPFLTLRLYLAESLDWYGEKYPNEEDLHSYFKNAFNPQVFLIESEPIDVRVNNSNYETKMLSILSNRQDANKFKNMIMPKLINGVKPLLQDLFSEHLQTTPDDFEKAIDALKNLRINRIYKDKIETGGSINNFKKQFFAI